MVAIFSASGRFYAFDGDNADRAPPHPRFEGTGTHALDGWICAENRTAAAGGDFDFVDVSPGQQLAATQSSARAGAR
jgi:hypothetical protein